MAYRFGKDEAIPHAAQRVFAEEIAWAVGQLVRSKKRVEAVHEARKSIKKIRGLLSLVGAKAHDRHFRDAARLLSDLRDNDVMPQVFDSLVGQHPDLDAQAVKAMRSGLRRPPAEKIATAEVVKMLQGVKAPDFDGLSYDSLLAPLAAVYRRGRKAFKRAQKEPSSKNLHDFRKEVKQHWYHLRLLEQEGMEQRLADLHDLEAWLGDEHNLNVLRAHLIAEAETSRDRQHIRQMVGWIDDEAESLRERALAAGEQLYAEKELGLRKPSTVAQPVRARSAVA